MTAAEGWTIAEAREELARTGAPVDRLARLIWCLPGFPVCGYADPGPNGGRRFKRYPIGDLQRLHGFLAGNGWLTPPEDPEDAAAARRARASIKAGEPVIPWEQVKAEAGLAVPPSGDA